MIRDATPSDCPAIAAIWNAVIRDTLVTFTTEERSVPNLEAVLEEKARAGHPFLVAGEREVLGFATYGSFRAGSGYAFTMEHTIILRPEARGRGIGRALMHRIEDHAWQAGLHSLIAGVSGANDEGRAFHEALGFQEVAILPEVAFKAGQWLDLVLMQKMLRMSQ